MNRYIIIIAIVFLTQTVLGQTDISQSGFDHFIIQTNRYLDSVYSRDIKFFSGCEYFNEFRMAKNHQYFQKEEFQDGYAYIKDVQYPDLSLLYDLYKDKLICKIDKDMDNSSAFVLNKEAIDSFAIGSLRFVRFNSVKIKGKSMQSVYYEKIYEGKYKLYAKWSKEYIPENTPQYIGYFHKSDRKLYLQKDNEFFLLKNRRTIRKLLNDKEKEIKNYLQKNEIILKNAPNEQLRAIMTFYESLL